MCWVRSGSLAILCLGLASPPSAAAIHFGRPPCANDEAQSEVLDGVSGYICAPRCAENTYDCPSDVPDFAAAQPQCMLKDVNGGAYCALLCSVDTQCPNGARCQRLQQAGVGICMFPLSFTDWVHQGTNKKLSYGLPQRKDRTIPPGVVQKAVAAVQNLKFKYGIQDGDADVVTVKEFLSSLSGGLPTAGSSSVGVGTLSASTGTVAQVAAPSVPSLPAQSSPAVAPPQVATGPVVAASPTQSGVLDGTMNVYRKDLRYAQDRLSEGLPGIQRAIGDAIDEAEHPFKHYNMSDLLRHIIELGLIYLAVGAIYKNQVLGASGMDMIPHISFWMEYPQLVNDGVIYLKQIVGGYTGQSGGGGFGGGFEPMGRAERDTFAQFEPSK